MCVTDNNFCNIYADNTVFVCTDNDIEKPVSRSMLSFECIQRWCKLDNIRVNVKKSKHMLVGGKRKECI